MLSSCLYTSGKPIPENYCLHTTQWKRRFEPLTFFGGMLGIEKRSPQGSTAETSK